MNKLAVALAFQLYLVSSTYSAEVLEDTIERTVPLGKNGTFSLQTIDGSVEIYGAEDNEIKIVATRKAFSPERLNAIQVRIDAGNDTVNIHTTGLPKERWGFGDRSGTIDYVINLPQHARIASLEIPTGEVIIHGMRGPAVNASLGNGRLISHNCFCDQTLRVQSGGLDLFFDWDEPRAINIEGTIINGNAHAIIPADASFKLHAVSVHGKVASDFTEVAQRKRGGVTQINETVGPAPSSTLTLRATDGNIRILEALW